MWEREGEGEGEGEGEEEEGMGDRTAHITYLYRGPQY